MYWTTIMRDTMQVICNASRRRLLVVEACKNVSPVSKSIEDLFKALTRYSLVLYYVLSWHSLQWLETPCKVFARFPVILLLLLHPFVFSMVLGDTVINKILTYFHKTIYLTENFTRIFDDTLSPLSRVKW